MYGTDQPKQGYRLLRVSTERQRRSGLGIEAKREAVARFAESKEARILAEFVEAETAKGADAAGGRRL